MELTKKEKFLMFGLICDSELVGELGIADESDEKLFLKCQQEVYGSNKGKSREELLEVRDEIINGANDLFYKLREELNKF